MNMAARQREQDPKRQRTIGNFFSSTEGGGSPKFSPRATIRNAKCPNPVPLPRGWTSAADSGVACHQHNDPQGPDPRAKIAAFDFDG